MNNSAYLKENFSQVVKIVLLGVFTLSVGLILAQGLTFDFSKLVPGLSFAAALHGIRKAREVYKTTKRLRTALKIVTGWSGVSLVISVLGDAAVGYLLDHHIYTLASW
ncbi:hypothetical protein [Staphylococcus delphini]|uniref:Uncharacterized protein n=1 Tax=Staphylococcus delphini TaxID=53344 RepID=A0AAQ0S0M2_9STAP|nr:hypothetical protein [Staphylococcus delphini]PCF46556.1 hypothetical protein B5B98_03990 [Staphylococcus delphini]PCF50267.1 hypothetical protein B5C07_07045 [Staphylococcus delphini]PCF75037.1 hypothetical protein B4W73_05605 [Staphylococcus delphini]PNZ90187.1 hypothetical protein CD148_11800 [Staphylococcus delphini]RIZ55536.1 hypothetical protein CDL68_02255 [Staphylococcus delphini]